MATYVIGDTHFGKGTAAARTLSKSISEHDQKVTDRWNETVGDKDTVIHMGDITENNYDAIKGLKGKKTLIRGNNDTLSKRKYKKLGFKKVHNKPRETKTDILSHEPIAVRIENAKRNIHGHTHGDDVVGLGDAKENKYLNASMDAIGGSPMKLSDVKVRLKRSKYDGSRYRPKGRTDGKKNTKYDVAYDIKDTSEARGLPSFSKQKELAARIANS